MATRRKFKSKTRQPFLFDIDGAEFETTRRISGAMFVDFIRVVQSLSGNGKSVEAAAELGVAIHEMYASVMDPEEFDRFWKWAKSPDGCDFETLVEVLGEMVAGDADRPTKRPTPSGSRPRSAGTTSTES